VACRDEIVGDALYRFCPDDPTTEAGFMRAVVRARAIDEITQEPVSVDMKLSSTVQGLRPRAASGGIVGLVGQPGALFPKLDTNSVALDLRIEAPGYLPLDLSGSLGPIVGFPGVFLPLDFHDAPLHRGMVEIRGRTVERSGLTTVVVAGATLSLVGYWDSFPPANVVPSTVIQAPNFVSVSPYVYATRLAGTTCRRQDLPPVAGQDKALVMPVGRGGRRVRLSDRVGVNVGTRLILDPLDTGRREYMNVASVNTSSTADQPAWVELSHPLAFTHLGGVMCQVAGVVPPGPPNVLNRDTIPGDGTLFLNALAGLSSGIVVEVDDGVLPPEYHEVQLYETLSDADGFFLFPPVSRVAMVSLHAQKLPLVSPDDETVTPDYRQAENRLTVVFP
jgi:hypothetical protein